MRTLPLCLMKRMMRKRTSNQDRFLRKPPHPVCSAQYGAWDGCLNPDFMRQCSEDIDNIWKEWLAAAEIDVHQMITHGEYGITLIKEPFIFGG